MVEKTGGRKLKKLRSDNDGKFTSTNVQEYLRAEGVTHELTIPKTPQQMIWPRDSIAPWWKLHALCWLVLSYLVGCGQRPYPLQCI